MVIESIDGAGTSTQMKLLEARAREEGLSARFTFEPTEGLVGQQIRRVLAREHELRPETLALLYAADRNEHLFEPAEGILATVRNGQWVFCDRYLFSSLAYQGSMCDWDFVFALNSRFPLPEHLVFIDLPPEEAERRRQERTKDGDLLEGLSLQQTVYDQYKRVIEHYTGSGMRIHLLDGHPDPQTISDQIWRAIFR